MKKLLISITAIFMLATGLFANGLDNKNAIGMYVLAGNTTVGGIQYEHRFSSFIGTKFGAFAFYDDDGYTDPFNMNLTVHTDFTLYETDWRDKICSRLFAYALAGYDARIARTYDYENDKKKTETFVSNAIASAGFGFDFIFFDHLSVPVQFGFMGTFPNEPKVGFCGGIGVRYSW